MEKKGALRGHEVSFHFRILQGTARALLSQLERGEQPDINLPSFFESTGIAVCQGSIPSSSGLDCDVLDGKERPFQLC
jgi:hypothetical protein